MGTAWCEFTELCPLFLKKANRLRASYDAADVSIGLTVEGKSTMKRVAGNGLTLEELEHIEEAAHHSQTNEAKLVLRLAAALREALQMEANACALCELKNHPDRNPLQRAMRVPGQTTKGVK